MLTAKSTLDDKLEGLENGGNDYLTKPFHIEELIFNWKEVVVRLIKIYWLMGI